MHKLFSIVETLHFSKKLWWVVFRNYHEKIKNFVYPQLKINPYYWSNIKKLRWEFAWVYRYRVWNMRLFYTIDEDKVVVVMVNIDNRKDAYK